MTGHVEGMDYNKLNDILNQIEPYFVSLARECGLKEVSVTRWRWDEPSLMLKWKGGDDLERNIYIFIVDKISQVQIECNAWEDKNYNEGDKKVRLRKWKHQNINQIDASLLDEIKKLLRLAYQIVAEWKEEDLQTVDVLH